MAQSAGASVNLFDCPGSRLRSSSLLNIISVCLCAGVLKKR